MSELDILRKIENKLEPYIGVIPYFEQEGNADYLETLKQIKELGIKKDGLILDVGTGFGTMPMALSELSFRVYAIDKKNYLERSGAAHFFKEYGISFDLVDVSNEKFPFPDNFFDCVISLNVIEHLDKSPKNYLNEIYRVLKKKGFFILVNPNFARLDNRVVNILRSSHPLIFEYFYNAEEFEGHIREYIPKEINKMLVRSGFKLVKTYTINVANLSYYSSYKKVFRIVIRILQKIFFFDRYNKERTISISIKE